MPHITITTSYNYTLTIPVQNILLGNSGEEYYIEILNAPFTKSVPIDSREYDRVLDILNQNH